MDFIILLIFFGFIALMLFDMAEMSLNPEQIKNDPLFQFYNWLNKGPKQNHK